ncbi:MAG: hypothetical protein ACR5LG_09950 [Sodalis sp. (in: enterobacteria)]
MIGLHLRPTARATPELVGHTAPLAMHRESEILRLAAQSSLVFDAVGASWRRIAYGTAPFRNADKL